MAPIRRYLRITKYSVLEVRIYLDNPALADSWLLNTRDPVLPRVFQAIRPLVLPKLREENERAKGKSKKQKGFKDVVREEDFEVSIFLTENSTRHSVLSRQKQLRNKVGKAARRPGNLTGWLTGNESEPITVGEEDEAPVVVREESDDDQGPNLHDFPPHQEDEPHTSSTRKRQRAGSDSVDTVISDDEGFMDAEEPGPKKMKASEAPPQDEKKLNLHTEYDGFSIYGRILCLVVKQRGAAAAATGASSSASGGGQQMLENWVSTQAAQELPALED